MFKINDNITPKQDKLLKIFGTIIIFSLWEMITLFKIIPKSILPSPIDVICAFPKLIEKSLVEHLFYSVKLNVLGLLEAILISVPVGFVIGLFPFINNSLEKYISTMRYLPLTALTGLFIIWFGIGNTMKIHFLSFAIFLYLLPCVIDKVKNIDQIYLQTAKTCGCSNWKLITKIYFPVVSSGIFEDIKNLSALSWTYIVLVELVNAGQGGIGALSYICARQSKIDEVFCVLVIIMLAGVLQDYFLKLVDQIIFKHKYQTEK